MSGDTMRAAVVERYGPPEVVEIREVPKPVPADDEVLVRVTAATVNSGDARVRALRVPRGLKLAMRAQLGIRGPKNQILGFDCAGVVDAVGSEVTALKEGDRVVASREFEFGCHAEYVAIKQDGVVAPIPDDVSDQDAVSLLFGASTSLNFLRKGKLTAGESILVNGASGAVGTMAVQLAEHMGAEVTGVCSAANADTVAGLGADHVIDHTADDFTANGKRYDVIMDCHGNVPYSKAKGSLAPGGRYLMIVGGLWPMIAATRQPAVVNASDTKGMVSAEAYREVIDLAASGVLRPVIDRVFPFDEIVEAYRRVDTGHKVGSIVLTF